MELRCRRKAPEMLSLTSSHAPGCSAWAHLTATAESWSMEHRVPQKGSCEAICEQVLNRTV